MNWSLSNGPLVKTLNSLPEDEAVILSNIQSTISSLSVKQIESNEPINLRPLRLDWFRFQTYTSVSKLSFSLIKHTSLAKTLNTIVFHSKLVDSIEELLYETSDLSLFWSVHPAGSRSLSFLHSSSSNLSTLSVPHSFYPNLFFENFHLCFEYPSQLRYSIAFPLVCAHFMSCTHELCPEEVSPVPERPTGDQLLQWSFGHFSASSSAERASTLLPRSSTTWLVRPRTLSPRNATSTSSSINR